MIAYFTEELKNQIEDCLLRHDTSEAKVLAEDLRRALIALDNDFSISEEVKFFWHNLLIRLQLQSLALFFEEEIVEFFKKNFLEMVNDDDINLYERFHSKQLVVSYELAEDFLFLIIEAIHANEETIGKNGIFIPGEAGAVEPTIKNWLLDYDRTYGTRPQEDITWLDYVAQSRNARPLSPEERSLLRKVLKFYEFLKPEYVSE